MEPQRKRILTEVARHLQRIGSANDAEDHHYEEDTERMLSEACAYVLVGILYWLI